MLNKCISIVLSIVLINSTSHSANDETMCNNSGIEINKNALDNGYYKNTIAYYNKKYPKYLESHSKHFPSKLKYIEEIKNKIRDDNNKYNNQLKYYYYMQSILAREYQYWDAYDKFAPYYKDIINNTKQNNEI